MHKLSVLLTPFPCAVLFCLANAFKPALIDDLGYIWFIRPILDNPLQPFGPPPDGFRLIWYAQGQGSFALLTPMVMPYWLAIGASFFGENLVLLKLWLFPFCLLFATAIASLLRRFAPAYAKPFLAMTIFSPSFLPSINVMVDVPALALGLSALAIFLKALDSKTPRWRWVLLAGLLAGLAAQTKYTGTTATASILLYAILHRRWREGAVAAAIAIAIFVGWEAYLSHVYGRTHFLLHLEQRESTMTFERKLGMIGPLIGVLGSLTPAMISLLLLASRYRRSIVLGSLGLMVFGFLFMALVPESLGLFYRHPTRVNNEVSISTIVAGVNGAVFTFLMVGVIGYLGWRGWSKRRPKPRFGSANFFLVGWLLIELVAYFPLSPFAAARRAMGIIVVSTMLTGRLLNLTDRRQVHQNLVSAIALFGVGLGVLFAWTDYRDALVEKRGLQESVAWIRQQSGGERRIWFTGHWGFHYYGREAGLRAVDPGTSTLDEGDWLIYPDTRLRPYGQLIDHDWDSLEKLVVIEWHDRWPLRTIPDFYGGAQSIRHHEEHRLRVTIYRVKKQFQAQPP